MKYCFLSTRYLTDILEMLQGLWIFIAFVLFNPEILLKNLIASNQDIGQLNRTETNHLVDDVDSGNRENVNGTDS